MVQVSKETEVSTARSVLDGMAGNVPQLAVGTVVRNFKVKSNKVPFKTFPWYRVTYPKIVIEALAELYTEYNEAFASLIDANREWDEDYQYCASGPGDSLVNWGVQIDMRGLPEDFLAIVSDLSPSVVKEVLRGSIFEIENSLAMYQCVQKVNPRENQSVFNRRFREGLNDVRERFKKPIALLAVTDEKYAAMLKEEFGVLYGDRISDEEVRALSGFDRFFGPMEFEEHVKSTGGRCEYVLFVRSSWSTQKLRKPKQQVIQPLLSDPRMRRIIKGSSMTFNVDAPQMDFSQRINDTKGYMMPMGMCFPVTDQTDLFSHGFCQHLKQGRAFDDYPSQRLSDSFVAYLKRHGINPDDVISGKQMLRAKPMKGAYGCYGHISGCLDKSFASKLRSEMRKRGDYVIQLEMPRSRFINFDDGVTYEYIDRNFMAMIDGEPVFLGGFRSMLDEECEEAQQGRNHGSEQTVWGQIFDTRY